MKISKTCSPYIKCVIFLLVCGIYALRYSLISPVLPAGWTPFSLVRFTARIVQQPVHTDSYTLVRLGIWTIILDGYAAITPGRTYSFVGTVRREVLLGKESRIVMINPAFVPVPLLGERPLKTGERILRVLDTGRTMIIIFFQKSLPEPHGSLAAGILLGASVQMPADFYASLISTGTVHVIAASGYNVSMVSLVFLSVFLKLFRRWAAVLAAVCSIVLYVLLAGSSPSVVRAGIMAILASGAYFWGRPADAKRLLWTATGIMLFSSPRLISDIGFQLSVAATAGLLYLEPALRGKGKGILVSYPHVQTVLSDLFYPTLAASISTLPIIIWHFGRISIVSLPANMFVLPVIPLIMFLSACLAVLGWLPALAAVLSALLYVPLAYLVHVISIFG